MKDRFVKVEDGKIVLVGVHKFNQTDARIAKLNAEILAIDTKLGIPADRQEKIDANNVVIEDLENQVNAITQKEKPAAGDPAKVADLMKQLHTLQGQNKFYQSEIDKVVALEESLAADKVAHQNEIVKLEEYKVYLGTFEVIQVADEDFGISAQHDWWKIKTDGKPRKPTTAEKEEFVAARLAKAAESAIAQLYQATMAYQRSWIDENLESELMYARNLVKFNGAQASNFPKAGALGQWKRDLWGQPSDAASETGSYYARKNNLLAGGSCSLDYSDMDPAPGSYQDLAGEVAAYEAS